MLSVEILTNSQRRVFWLSYGRRTCQYRHCANCATSARTNAGIVQERRKEMQMNEREKLCIVHVDSLEPEYFHGASQITFHPGESCSMATLVLT